MPSEFLIHPAILNWPRSVKRLVVVALDVVMSLVAMWLAFTLRLDTPHRPLGVEWLIYAMGPVLAVPIAAVFGVLRVAISGLSGLIIVYAVLSWVRTDNPLADVVERLCAPPLAPIRRLLPLVGGIDLSPLVLLVLLQIALIVLNALEPAILLL